MSPFFFFLGLIAGITGQTDRAGCNQPAGHGADECYHHSSFNSLLDRKEILGRNCEKYRKWAKWIHLPNYFNDTTIGEVEDRIETLADELEEGHFENDFR